MRDREVATYRLDHAEVAPLLAVEVAAGAVNLFD
jgi:hypothetical protein